MLAAGAAIDAAESVLAAKRTTAFALVRPPGHHAMPDRAMGFCLVNNVAVAALHLLAAGHVRRLAVLDFDIHHGNGTEAALAGVPQALFVSFHRFPFYPGSGAGLRRPPAARPRHRTSSTCRSPTTRRASVYLARWCEVLETRVAPFAPEILLVSAGFDLYRYDPVGGLNFHVDDFRSLGRSIMASAEKAARGRVATVLEGGYDLEALPKCLVAYLEGLGAL